MIEYMVVALPRSGTAWAANWLTTDTTLCIHEPLFRLHYSDWDTKLTAKEGSHVGVACTGIHNFPDYLKDHPARKVVLHRDVSEINKSLKEIGLEALPADAERGLMEIDGLHAHWLDIFENPKTIYEFLLSKEFDKYRHRELVNFNVQCNFETVYVDQKATQKLINEVQSRRLTTNTRH